MSDVSNKYYHPTKRNGTATKRMSATKASSGMKSSKASQGPSESTPNLERATMEAIINSIKTRFTNKNLQDMSQEELQNEVMSEMMNK